MKYDVIIVGAGPAGLFSALSLESKKVLIIEKNKYAGKKLMISGAGQCNYTNSCELSAFLSRYGSKGRLLKNALYNFTNIDTMEFFEKKGLKSMVREDGKVFPITLDASDILKVLLKGVKENGVEIIYDEAAIKAEYDSLKGMFTVKTNKSTYAGARLIVSAGGMSYPLTGSTGDGYLIAQEFGHKIVKPSEALTPVYVRDYGFKDLSGVSFEDIKVSQWRYGRKLKEFTGDFLFTHVNISGPVILNNSRYFEKDDILKINFTSYSNNEEFRTFLDELILSSGGSGVVSVLKRLNLPKRFIEKIIEIGNIDGEIKCSQLHKEERRKLCELLSAHPFTVERLGGFNVAMVTKGGVAADEINFKTMESKLQPNLYFAGEIIDYDGDTGGYNIQAAFSTGRLAADSINHQNT